MRVLSPESPSWTAVTGDVVAWACPLSPLLCLNCPVLTRGRTGAHVTNGGSVMHPVAGPHCVPGTPLPACVQLQLDKGES